MTTRQQFAAIVAVFGMAALLPGLVLPLFGGGPFWTGILFFGGMLLLIVAAFLARDADATIYYSGEGPPVGHGYTWADGFHRGVGPWAIDPLGDSHS
jgi:hypothetical protein